MGKTARFIKTGNGARETALCEQAAALFGEGGRVYVRAASRAQAMGLDDLLWTFRDDTFVPHGLWSGESGFRDPVAVGWKDGNPNGAGTILLGSDFDAGELLAAVEGYERAVDFIPEADPAATQAARERYRILRDAGWTLSVEERKKR